MSDTTQTNDSNTLNALDCVSRQAAIDALEREKTYSTAYKDGYTQTDYFKQYNKGLTDGIKALNKLPSAQPKQGDKVVFWKKRAKEYKDMISVLVAEQAKGIKIDSVEITEKGIIFKKSKPERTKGKWKQGRCSECGYDWGKDAPIASVPNFCPNCGADMRKETEDV